MFEKYWDFSPEVFLDRKSAETVKSHGTGLDCPLSRIRVWLVFWLSPTEPCNLNFTDPEADVEILQRPDSAEECNYLVTVYLGYGIEVQVSTKGFLMAWLITTTKVMNEQTPAWIVGNNTPVFITPATLAGSWGGNCTIRATWGFIKSYNPVKCVFFLSMSFTITNP